MTRIESIIVLLEAEARERVKSRDDYDYAAAVHDVSQDVSLAAMDIMIKYRSLQREGMKGA